MQPSRLLRLSRSFVEARALQLATSKGLFDFLAESPGGRSWQDVGQHMGFIAADGFRGTRDFLDLLVSVEVLERTGGPGCERYSNAPEAAAFLVRGQPGYIGGYVALNYDRTFKLAVCMEEALTAGQVSEASRQALGVMDIHQVFREDPQAGIEFARAASSNSAGNFRALAAALDLSPYRTLADVGGSLGTLCIELCRAHPHLAARSCDLPNILGAARENVAAQGMAGRVEVVPLDMFTEAFPPADVITMSQILHDWGLERKKLLMRKAFDALPPGGVLVVVERLLDDERRHSTYGLAQSLVMLQEFGAENAFDFSFSEFQGWATEVGFARCQLVPLLPDWGAAVAYKAK